MFANLFKRTSKPSKPKNLKQEILSLDPQNAKDRKRLIGFITGSTELGIGEAAIQRFQNQNDLTELLKLEIEADKVEFIHRQQISLLEESELEQMGVEQLIHIVIQHPQVKFRLTAAQAITDEMALHRLSRESKDKSVRKYVKGALLQLRSEREKIEQEAEEIGAICQVLEGLAGRAHIERSYLYKHQQALLKWEEYKDRATTLQQQRYQIAMAACTDDVAELKRQREDEQRQQEARGELIMLLANVETILNRLKVESISIASLEGSISQFEGEWEEICKSIEPESEQSKRYDFAIGVFGSYLQALEFLTAHENEIETAILAIDSQENLDSLQLQVDSLRGTLQWPVGLTVPSLAQRWQAALEEFATHEKAQQRESLNLQKQVGELRHRLAGQIKSGELKRANTTHTRIYTAINKLPASEQQQQRDRLQSQEEALQKLRDWHHFSTNPKKESLCVEMEALIENDLSPLELRDAISALQSEWREQTAVNIIEDDPLWERFQKAGHQAYEPCGAYFKQQDQLKADNLKSRKLINQQLSDYLEQTDWEHADWKMVSQVIKSAREEWKLYEPVRFPDAKPVHKTFFSLLDQLKDKLNGYREDNQQLKEKLLDQARSAEKIEDIKQAIDRIIYLQKEWKGVGETFYKKERPLWLSFKKAGDIVFARRDQQHKNRRAEEEGLIVEAKALIKALQDLGRVNDETLIRSGEQVSELETKFSEIFLPEKELKRLENQFDKARKAYQNQLSGIDLRRQQISLNHLAACADLCNQAESAIICGDAIDSIELEDSWEQHYPHIDASSMGVSQRLEAIKRAVAEGASTFTQMEENLEALLQLAIEIEILSDSETPNQYKDQRMAYQLMQLSQGLGQVGERKEALYKARKRWYLLGAIDPAERKRLQQRLEQVSF